jgi:hypothetical protein
MYNRHINLKHINLHLKSLYFVLFYVMMIKDWLVIKDVSQLYRLLNYNINTKNLFSV